MGERLVRRAEAVDYAIAANDGTLVKALDRLTIMPPAEIADPPSKKVFCAAFPAAGGRARDRVRGALRAPAAPAR